MKREKKRERERRGRVDQEISKSETLDGKESEPAILTEREKEKKKTEIH